ncbi:hypothetical protein [Nonomuraea dietziae]|uniref:hypothetical protein n=1 Tax=Nonomuraea dietziae TaxID=65515 RepID=UPI003420E334
MEPKLTSPFEPEPSKDLAAVVQLRGEQPADAPAQAAPTRPRPPRGSSSLARAARGWVASAAESANGLLDGGDGVLHDRLPSVAQLWTETVEARWAPADAKALIFFGRAYRLLVALPVSLIAYPLLYLAHRPLRLFLAVAVGAIAYTCIVIFGG